MKVSIKNNLITVDNYIKFETIKKENGKKILWNLGIN